MKKKGDQEVNYIQLKEIDIANGPGVRMSLWVSGCNIHCKGCHNPEAFDFNAGKKLDINSLIQISDLLKRDHIAGLSILGGEPLDNNIEELEYILSFIKRFNQNKTIWLYTGHVITPYMLRHNTLFKYIDVVVDGPYIENKHFVDLRFRGSTNQRIINVKESIKRFEIVLMDEYMS